MSSSASLYVKDKVIFTYRDGVDPEMFYLFSTDELLHLRGNEAAKYATSWIWDIDDMSSEEIEELDIFVYAAPAGVLKDRLNVLGFCEALVKGVFEEELEDDIERTITFAQKHADKDLKYVGESLKELQELDYDTWTQQVDAYILSKRSAKKGEIRLNDDGPLKIPRYTDQKILFRAILEHIDEAEIITLDPDLEESGWFSEQDGDSALREGWEFNSNIPIIITEGIYDVQVLKGAIEVLKPHLASYIRFLDYDFGNEGGGQYTELCGN